HSGREFRKQDRREDSNGLEAQPRLPFDKGKSGLPPPLVSHLESHELTHLKLESEARKVGKNLFFATTARTRETAIRSVAGDIRKWEKAGYSEQKITQVTLTLINGLCEFLFNCPLDMLIERHIRDTF